MNDDYHHRADVEAAGTLKGCFKNALIGIIAVLVVAVIVWLLVGNRPKTPLLVQDGVAYHLFSYDLNVGSDGQSLYLVTFGYLDEYEKASKKGDISKIRRGTILIPKACCTFDDTLPPRSVKWESSEVEGKEYRIVRMHPLVRVKSDGGVPIKEEAPLLKP